MNGIRLGLLMSLVCKVSSRGMSAARRICLLTKLCTYHWLSRGLTPGTPPGICFNDKKNY